VLVAALVAFDLARTGRARPPLAQREAAVAAFERARGDGSARWAPAPSRAADEALRAALFEWSRQGARLLPLRDFRPAAAALGRAEALAAEALRQTRDARARGRASAERAIGEALAIEAQARSLVNATTLPFAQRTLLQRARLQVREAEALLRYGEIDAAHERAERSRTELRDALGPALEAASRYTSQDEIATWRRWVDETRAWSRATRQPAILVLKEKNRLVLLSKGSVLDSYAAEIGANALDVKRHQGDRATPEGRYRIVAKKSYSRFHRALLLDYPNPADRARFAAAQRRGEVPRDAQIGGLIEIHGEGGRGQNWTDGCIALSNGDMDELFSRVSTGTRVTIVGGDGRDGAFSDLLRRVGETARTEHDEH
jgi:lipoprotein-anchoring transpeptidase ErfK/SrfK